MRDPLTALLALFSFILLVGAAGTWFRVSRFNRAKATDAAPELPVHGILDAAAMTAAAFAMMAATMAWAGFTRHLI